MNDRASRPPLQELSSRYFIVLTAGLWLAAALFIVGPSVIDASDMFRHDIVRRVGLGNFAIGALLLIFVGLQRALGDRRRWQERGFERTLFAVSVLAAGPWFYTMHLAGSINTTALVGPLFLLVGLNWIVRFRVTVSVALAQVVGFAVLSVLESNGVLPYAPVLVDRQASMDVFNTPPYWLAAGVSMTTAYFIALFSLRRVKATVDAAGAELSELVTRRTVELQAANSSLTAEVEAVEQVRRSVGEVELELEVRRSELERAGRVAALGELAERVASELARPIDRLCADLSDLVEQVDAGGPFDADFAGRVKACGDTNRSAAESVRRLRSLFSPAAVERAEVQVAQVVHGVGALLRPTFERLGVHVTIGTEGDGPFVVVADENLLRQAVFNLMSHAHDRSKEHGGGVVEVRVWRDGDDVCVDVADRAPATMRVDGLPLALDPSSSSRSRVVGLGLARHAMDAHGARLEQVETDDGTGCARLRFERASLVHAEEALAR